MTDTAGLAAKPSGFWVQR